MGMFVFKKKEEEEKARIEVSCTRCFSCLKTDAGSKRVQNYESRSTEQLFCRFSPHPTIHIHVATLPPLGLEEMTLPYVF